MVACCMRQPSNNSNPFHPRVVAVRKSDVNEATKLPVICPITSGSDFARRVGFAVPLTGVKTIGVVRCDQPRVLDLHDRDGRKVDTLPVHLKDEVGAKLAPIFE